MTAETNPDRVLVLKAQEHPSRLPLALDSSPLGTMLRAKLTDVGENVVGMTFDPDERFTQAMGALQGGSVVAMLDFAMACAALACIEEGESVATVTLNASYLRPVLPGSLRCNGTVVRRGRTMVFATAELKDGMGRLVATATSAMARSGTAMPA